MTNREAFMYLGQVRGCDNKIKRLERTIESLKYNLLPGAIRYDKDRVDTSPQDSMTELFARIDEYQKELDIEVQKRTALVLMFDKELDALEDTNERIILKEYFLGNKSMRTIAEEYNFSVRHCFRLRNNGVSMFAEVMTND